MTLSMDLLFQFHKVRLKVKLANRVLYSHEVSIPQGTIKRIFGFLVLAEKKWVSIPQGTIKSLPSLSGFRRCRRFNSTRYD